MKWIFTFIILLILSQYKLLAQISQSDSLKIYLEKLNKIDKLNIHSDLYSQKLEAYLKISELYFFEENKFDEAIEYSNKALKLIKIFPAQYIEVKSKLLIAASLVEKDKNLKADTALSILASIPSALTNRYSELDFWIKGVTATCYFRKDSFERVINLLEQNLNKTKTNTNELLYAYFARNLGVSYSNMGIHDKAMKWLNASSVVYHRRAYFKSEGINLKFIGRSFAIQKSKMEPMEYYKKAIEKIRPYQDCEEICWLYTILADYYINQNTNLQLAQVYQDSCYQIALQKHYPSLLIHSFCNFGAIKETQDFFVEADTFYETTIKLAIENQDLKMITVAKISLAQVNEEMGRFELAIQYAESALIDAKKDGRKRLIVNALNILALSQKKMGHDALAYGFLQQYIQYNKLLYNEEIAKNAKAIEIQYRVKEKNHEIEDQQQKNQINRRIIWIMVVVVFIVLLLGFMIYSKNKKLKILNHFLFEKNNEIEKQWKQKIESEQIANESERTKYKSSTLAYEDAVTLAKQFKFLMNSEHPYLNSDFILESAAELLKTNRTYLSEALKAVTGETFSTIVTEYRVERAWILVTEPIKDNPAHLESSYMPIKAIAEAIGYKSWSSFNTAFQKRWKQKPTEARMLAINKKRNP